MSFQEIPGQEHAKRMLQNGLRNHTLSHAYIFSGPAGSGKRKMAVELAKAVYCTESEDDACGTCLNCRKVEHGNHPDFYWIEPDGASLKIDQVRELQREFSYRSTQSQTKIYVLSEADKLTIQAANSLLKFLEEPQSDILAVLITENGQALLPTIRSRSQWIPFTPLAVNEIVDALTAEGYPLGLAQTAAQVTAGVDAARALLEGKWFAEARNVVVQLAKEALTRVPAAMLTVQQKVVKSDLAEHLPVMLDLLILWFKDMIHIRYGRKDRIVYIEEAEWLSREAQSREVGAWVICMEQAAETQKRLRFHANPQLALEKLIIDLQGG